MTMLDKALALASEGFRVFPAVAPLMPGEQKKPKWKGWQESATREPDAIREWEPPFNIGIATGDGFAVIDVDVKKEAGGDRSLFALELEYGDLPPTREARTPSGGRHLYFTTSVDLPNPVGRKSGPMPGIDVRGKGGFVLGVGSEVGGVPYEWVNDLAMAPMPDWLEKKILAAKRREVEKVDPPPHLDLDAARGRAVAYLQSAEPAVEGGGGDNWTFAVACRVKNLGVSDAQEICDLMLDHWNDRCSPPWQPDDLLVKCQNAMRHSQEGVGSRAPESEFGPVDLNQSDLKPGVLTWDDVSRTEPREWLYGDKLLRRYVSLLVSPGGVGKTAWTTVAALALASNRTLLHDKPHAALRVWLYNLEDDMDEVKRRLRAAAEYHDIPPEVVTANIRANSGRDRGLKLVKTVNDTFVTLPDKDKLIAAIKQDAIDVLIVDPFLRSHSVPENSNEAQDKVLNIYSDIAEATRSAILLIHHTKKGAVAGDPESARGGSSQIGGARKVMTMAAMTPEEAEKLDVREEERRLHVRIDDGKQNMSPPATVAEWLKLASVSLHNGTPEYPNGDNVQVVRKWTPPDPWLGVTPDQIEECLAAIEKGLPGGERYTAHKRSTERWVVPLIASMLGKSESLAGQILAKWRSNGTLAEEEYLSPSQRRSAKGLFRRKEGLV